MFDEAIEYYKNAVELAKASGEIWQLPVILNNLAQAQIDFGCRTSNAKYLFLAQSNLHEAFEIDKAVKDTYNQAVRLLNIGQVYYYISQFGIGTIDSSGGFNNIGFEMAIKNFSLALEVFKRLGSLDRALVCLVNLGGTSELHGHTKEAQRYDEDASVATVLRSDIMPAIQTSIKRLKQIDNG